MQKTSGIYTITHVASGKKYVGQSARIRDRWLWHKSSLRRGKSANRILQNAWNKYGEDAFLFEIIEECDPTEVALCKREQFWIDTLKPAYNIAPVGGTTRGLKHPPRSEAFRQRAREMKTGFRHSAETIATMKAKQPAGWKHTLEARAKISARLQGQKFSPERIEKMRVSSSGKKQSQETIAKRVAKLKGRACSDYTKARTAEANRTRLTGTKQSADLIEKRIAPLRGRARAPHLIYALHETLRKSREAKAASAKGLIAANLHLTVTELCKLVGLSFKPVSRYKKELLCHTPQQNGSAADARSLQKRDAKL